MTANLASMKDLARRMLAFEAARAVASDARVDAAVRVCEQLQGPLVRLAGIAGFSSLLSRALALAKVEAPTLRAVSARPDGSLAGFDEIGQDPDAGELEKPRLALVAHLLGLLATFIGESLTLRLACDAWPDASIHGTDPKPGERP